jgi:pentatricopeptide repeat protein
VEHYRSTVFFLIVCFAIQCSACCQPASDIYSVHQGRYTFGIKRNNSELVRTGNTVINQLSLQLAKSPEKTHYSITYSYNLLSGKLENGTWKVGLRLNVNSISGDTSINGFNISNLLLPQLASFDISLIDTNGFPVDSAFFSDIIPGHDTGLSFPHPTNQKAITQILDIALEKIHFGYNDIGLKKITQQYVAIRTYHAASLLADFAQKQSENLNRQAINPYPELLMQIDELSRAVSLLAQLQNQWDIGDNSPDPGSLVSKQRILAYRVHLIQKLFLKNISSKTTIKSGLNIRLLSMKWVSMQVNRLTDQNIPGLVRIVFYQLGQVPYAAHDLIFIKQAVSLILHVSRPELLPEGFYWSLSDAISKAYLREGERLCASNQYAEAIDLLGNAASMSGAIPFATCSNLLYRQQAVARYGVYHAYIQIARKAIAAHKSVLAKQYAAAATSFQQKNRTYIISDIEVQKLCDELAGALPRSADLELKSPDSKAMQVDPDKPEIFPEAAKSVAIIDSLPVLQELPVQEQIITVLWPDVFQQMIARVDSLINTNNSLKAVELYAEAGKLFLQKNMANTGLAYLPLAEYAGTRHNLGFYSAAISFFLHQDRFEESLTLLSRMEVDKFPPDDCREVQELVAKQIARRDNLGKNSGTARQHLLAYTGDSTWYSHFGKMYLKTIHP